MECGRDSALTSKHPGPLRPNKYVVMHWEGGAGGRAGLQLVLLQPEGFLNPFCLGRK